MSDSSSSSSLRSDSLSISSLRSGWVTEYSSFLMSQSSKPVVREKGVWPPKVRRLGFAPFFSRSLTRERFRWSTARCSAPRPLCCSWTPESSSEQRHLLYLSSENFKMNFAYFCINVSAKVHHVLHQREETMT